MSKNNKNNTSTKLRAGLVPKLRFKEFENSGEWVFDVFSKYIKLYRGSSPRPIQNYLTTNKSGVNWIKIGDTKNADNFIIKQVEERITPEGAEKSRKVNIGELILANSMSFGKTYQLDIEGYIYDGWFVIREYEKHFDKQFLLQLLNSDYMQNQYKKLSAGGIVQNISSDIVYNTILSHTSQIEQQKIAACLSSLDDVITAESQKLEVLKEHKKGLLQNLFPQEGEKVPKLRFKEFEKDGEWEEKILNQVSGVVSGQSPAGESYNEERIGIPFYQGKADFGDIFLKEPTKWTTQPTKFANAGDILMSVRAPVGALNISTQKICIGRGLAALQPKENKWFLFYFLNRIQNSIIGNGGSVFDSINKEQIEKIGILIPKPQEQQKIAACLSSLDNLIHAQTQKIEALKEHKKGLLQGLFPQLSEQD